MTKQNYKNVSGNDFDDLSHITDRSINYLQQVLDNKITPDDDFIGKLLSNTRVLQTGDRAKSFAINADNVYISDEDCASSVELRYLREVINSKDALIKALQDEIETLKK